MPLLVTLAFAIFPGGPTQGVASALTFDPRFGVAFGVLSIIGLCITYGLGFAPSQEYRQRRVPVPHGTGSSRPVCGDWRSVCPGLWGV
jgi:hypothetical protein